VDISSLSIRHLTTTVVDDMERNPPINIPSLVGAPEKSLNTPHKSIANNTSMLPPSIETFLTCLSLDIENSTPREKRRKTTPNCARVST